MSDFPQFLISAFEAGRRQKMLEQQEAAKEKQLRQAQESHDLQSDYYAAQQAASVGQPDVMQNYQRMYPAQYQAQQGADMDQQTKLLKFDEAMTRHAVDQMKQQSEIAGTLLSIGKRNPQALPAINQRLQQLQIAPVDPGNIDAAIEQHQRINATFADPKIEPDLLGVIQKRHGLGAVRQVMADPQLRAQAFSEVEAIRAAEQAAKEKVAKSGATSITVAGNQPLEKTPTAKAQQTTIDASMALDKLNSIMKEARPEAFTYGNKYSTAKNVFLEKLGVAPTQTQADEIAVRTKISQQIEQAFNSYRVEVTGAAASEKELAMIRKSFLNMDLSWTQFLASANTYRSDLARKLRISRKVLREGLNVEPGQADTLIADMMQQGDEANSPTDRVSRMRQLKDQGLTPAETKQRLIAEGYMPGEGTTNGR